MGILANSYIGTEDAKPKIIALTKKTAQSQFEIGVILKELKEKVETFKYFDSANSLKNKHIYKIASDEYKNFIKYELPFGEGVANKLVQIASDTGIEKYLHDIPFAYNVMYELRDMPEVQWDFYFENGLKSTSTGENIKELKKKWKEKTSPKKNADDNSDVNEDEVYLTIKEQKSILGKNMISNKLDNLDINFENSNIQDDDEDGLLESYFQYLSIKVEAEKLTSFEKSKLKDLMKLVDKLKFSGDKGVTLDHNINVDILSDEPVEQVA